MNKPILISLCLAAFCASTAFGESVTLNGKDYEINTLINRDLGPGVNYKRLRLPSYPLNVNLITIDVTNPYNALETTQASDKLYSTELLTKAAARQTRPGHEVLAGANANFWCVSTQEPYSDLLIGATYNGNLQNGKIITETNSTNDKWNGGPSAHTGVFGVTANGTAVSNTGIKWKGYINNVDKFEKSVQFNQCNKIVREGEIAIYNSFFPASKTFMPVTQAAGSDGKQHFTIVNGKTTEVYLKIREGQTWHADNKAIYFDVVEVKSKPATNGKIGNYDLAVVGHGEEQCALLDKLQPGDELRLRYSWIDAESNVINFTNLIGGNAQVMVNGEMTSYATSENYNSQVYSRTAYGTSADGKTAYIIVIDKATDPVYGSSAGCSTTIMCGIAKHYGCVNMTNCDAGGSAEMLVNGKIINKTTESSPRAVANGMFVSNIAPEDNVITRLAFDEYILQVPPYATHQPKVLGYNQYGALIDNDVQGIVLTCDAEAGQCNGNNFSAGGKPGKYTITATYNGVSVTHPIEIVDADVAIRIKNLLIDNAHPYTMEVTAAIGDNIYNYDASKIEWTVENPEIASIDSEGKVTAHKNGTTNVTARIGDAIDQSVITVEIAETHVTHLTDWSKYTTSGISGISNISLDNEGQLKFTYAAPRNPYVTITERTPIYSIPDRVAIEFNSTCPLSKVSFDVRTPIVTRTNLVDITPETGTAFTTGESHTVYLPLAEGFDVADLINYPISFYYIRFIPTIDSANKGDHTIKINDIRVEYDHIADAVESIAIAPANATVSIYPNPTAAGQSVNVVCTSTIRNIEVFNAAGQLVKAVDADANHTSFEAPAAKGMYIVRIATDTAVKSSKIIVK